MNVLVAGAGGFIGGHLVKALLDRDDEVLAVDVKRMDDWHQFHGDAESRPDWDLTSQALSASAARGMDVIYRARRGHGRHGLPDVQRG